MKPYQVTYINGIILVIMGLAGYLFSESPSFTALIPVAIGAILIAMFLPMKKGNRAIAHVVVVLTLLTLAALYMPLVGSINRGNHYAVLRVFVMMITSGIAMAVYIKSFIDARRKKV